MPSLHATLRSASKYALPFLFTSPSTILAGSPPTCSNPQTSCMNTTAVADTCCFNAPGGQLLQTQFWDYSPPTGPSNSWTIHGLWPDHCDGTYDANCDASRAYTNISAIISAAGATDLLSYMNTYWKDYQGNDESFWEHEWGKHGTCISTLEPGCYTDYVPQQEVVDFFQKTVDLFKTLPSYTWLSDAGITPDSSKTYTSDAILAALKAPRGVTPVIQCANTNELDEIWYFYDVKGSVQTGTFIPTDPDGSKSDCPATGVKYLPKSGTPPSPPSTTTTPSGSDPTTSPGTPFSGKGTLQVTTSSKPTGCIISAGTWYTTGTCATFTAAASGSGFTLTSSKGKCGVVSGKFTCGTSVSTATVFSASGSALVNGAGTTWYASAVPSGSTQVGVETASDATGLVISWAGS
ncbi:MAG: Ribonuclease T2 precursor (RNase T2) [Ramalina farinacea]|uniref:Ribonuclease T2-like n=1 Tax=Ramalina farinacea TaxID=258253 RepID=A0AA43QE24_9LECA|nr:Ribonuclease T2 precursor (RNase T2) [Ramalina farinacea]